QTAEVAALAAEVLGVLPPEHRAFAAIADAEGTALIALGASSAARTRYESLLRYHEARAQAEPDRADFQRDLSVSYERIGDLYSALGQGQLARQAFQKSLDIAERLAKAEPDRADFQRDLAVSCSRMGDLYRDLGQGELARQAFQKAL